MTKHSITIALCILSTIACAPQLQPRLYIGALPPSVYVDLAGTFTLSPAGELALTLTQPCRDLNAPPEGMEALTWAGGDCARTLLDRIDVVATTPWGKQVPGAWLDGEHLVFRMDWKLSGLDPLDADVPVMITRPWTICETGRCALQTPTSR